jgi:hypothetical protein
MEGDGSAGVIEGDAVSGGNVEVTHWVTVGWSIVLVGTWTDGIAGAQAVRTASRRQVGNARRNIVLL